MDRTAEYSEDGTTLMGYTRRIGDTIKHAAWHPSGKYIGTFITRSRARQILCIDAKLAAVR